MVDCALCFVPILIAKETNAYILSETLPSKSIYKTYTQIKVSEISHADFRSNVNFTPGFRLRYDNNTASEALRHKAAWSMFLKTESPHAIIFDETEKADDIQLSIYLENKQLPKDWDIIVFPATYIINKRAAKILYHSAAQFDKPINVYISSFSVLKVIKA
jgi:hypothetical protein